MDWFATDDKLTNPQETQPQDAVDTPPTPTPAFTWSTEPESAALEPAQPAEPTYNILGVAMPRSKLEQSDAGKDFLRIQDAAAGGRRGFGEAITDFQREDTPFIGSVITVRDILNVRDTFKKLESGAEVSDDERVTAAAYWADMERKSQQGTAGMVGDILRQMPGFMVEIGAYTTAGAAIGGAFSAPAGGIAAVPAAAGGAVAGAAKTGGEIAARTVAKKFADSAIRKSMTSLFKTIAGSSANAKAFREGVRELAVVGTRNAVLDAGVNAAANIMQGENAFETASGARRQLANTLSGNSESDNMARMMGLGDQFIEIASESSGAAIGGAFAPLGQYLGKKAGLDLLGKGEGQLLRKVMDVTFGKADVDKAIKMAGTGSLLGALSDLKNIPLDRAYAFLKTAGYHGMLEEMGEERLGGFLKGLFGIEGDEAGLANAFDQMIPNSEQLAAEAIAFAVPSVGMAAVRRAQIGGNMSRFMQAVQTVQAGARPSEGVLVVDDTGAVVTPDKLKTETPEFAQVAGGVADIVESFENNKPQGFLGSVVNGLYRVVTGALTGSLSQTQGPQGYMDEVLGARGFSPLASIYRLTRDQALKHYAPDGNATPEQVAKARAAGITALMQQYQFDTKRLVVRKAELESVLKEAANDNGGVVPTGKALMDWIDAKSQGPNPLLRRITGPGGFTGWVKSNSSLLRVPSEKPAGPEAVHEWAMNRAAAKLLSKVWEPGGQVNVDMLYGTPAEKGESAGQAMKDLGLSLTERELADALLDPYNPKSIELAAAMRIGLASDGAKEKFQSELRYHLNMVQSLGRTKVYTDDAGHKIQLMPKAGDPGKYRPVLMDLESRKFVSSNKALNDLLSDPTADLPTNLASGMLGFREASTEPLTITFVPATSYASKSAAALLGMFPTYSSGIGSIKDPETREKAAATELKKLGGYYDSASGMYNQPIGAFNTESEILVSLYRSRAYDFSEDALEANWKRGYEDRVSRALLQSGTLSPEVLKAYERNGSPAIDRLFGAITDMLANTNTREANELRELYGDVGEKGYIEGLSKLANLYFFGFDYSHENRAYANSISQYLEQIAALPSFQQAMGEFMTAQGLMDTARGDTLSRADAYARMNPALDTAAKTRVEKRIDTFRWEPASAAEANRLAVRGATAQPSGATAQKTAGEKPAAKPAEGGAVPSKNLAANAAAVLADDEIPMDFGKKEPGAKVVAEPPEVKPEVKPAATVTKTPGRIRIRSNVTVKGKKPDAEGGDYSLATRLSGDKNYFDSLMRFAVDQYKLSTPGYPVELDYNPADEASVDAALYSDAAVKALYNLHVPGLSERLITELVARYRDAAAAAKATTEVASERSPTTPVFGALSEEALADLARVETEEQSAEHERGGESYDGEQRVEMRNAKDIVALSRIMYGHLVGRFGQNLLVQSLSKYVKDVGNAPIRDEAAFDAWRFGEPTPDGDLESLKDLASYMDLFAFRELFYDTVDQHVRDTQVATVMIEGGKRTLRLSGAGTRSSYADIATLRRSALRNILSVPANQREAFFRKVQSLLPYRQTAPGQSTESERLNALSPEQRVDAVNQVRDLLIHLTGSNRVVSWFGDWVAKNADNPDTWGAFVTLYSRLAYNLASYARGVSLDDAGWRKWATGSRAVFGLGNTRDKYGNREPSPMALLWNDHVKRFGTVAERVTAPAGGSKSTIVYRDQLDNQADAMRAAGHDVTVLRIPGVVYETRDRIGDSDEYAVSTVSRNDKDMDSNDMLEVMRAARNSGKHLYVVPSGDKNLVVGLLFNDPKLFAGSKSFEEDYSRMAEAYLVAAYGARSRLSPLAVQKRARVNTSGGSSLMKGLAGGLPDKVKVVVFDTKIGDGSLQVVGDFIEKTRVSVADPRKSILKALINGYDTAGTVAIVKSSMYLGGYDEGASHKALADAVASAGYFGYTDRGAAKEFSRAKKVEVAGLEGWEIEMDISNIGETTNLEHTTQVEERPAAHPNMYDTAAYAMGRAAYDEYVKFLRWAQANGVPEVADLKLDDIDAERNRFEYLLRAAGVAEGFPAVSENLRLSKLSRAKSLLRMPGYGAYSALLPANSPLDNKLTPAALANQLASRGLFDFERTSTATKPATFRANLRGNGVRTAYRVREGDKAADGSSVDMASAMRAVQRYVTAVRAQSEDMEAAHALLASMVVDEKGQPPSAYVNFEDLVNSDGSFDELSTRELPDGSVWFGGHKTLMHRVPGGDLHAAVFSRYWGPVQWVQNKKGTWVPAKVNVIIAHPAVVARGGIDFDGDMAHLRMAATSRGRFNRVLREEYAGKDVEEARIRAATRMFLAQTEGFETIPYDELTAHIDKALLDVVLIDTPTGRKTIAQVKKEETDPVDAQGVPVKPVAGVVALRDPSKFAEVTDIARAANMAKGIDVAEYRRMQVLLRQGVGFTPIGVTLPDGTRITAQRSTNPDHESDKLLHRLHQNVLNIIMDDLSDPTTKYLGLDPLTLSAFTTLSFGQDFKTWKDVIAFVQAWVDFSRAPIFAEMRKSIAANPFMTRDARLSMIAKTRPSMARNAAELAEVFAVNQQISAAAGYTTMLYSRPSDVDDFVRVSENGGYLRNNQFKNLTGLPGYVREQGRFASIGGEVEQALRRVAYDPAYGDPAVPLFPPVRRILKDQVHVSRNMEQKLLARIRTAPMADALTRMIPTQVVDDIVGAFYAIPDAATMDQSEAAAFVGRRVLRALTERQVTGEDSSDRPILDVLEVRTQADGSERVSSGGSIRSIDDGTLQQIHASWDSLDNVAAVTVKIWDAPVVIPTAAVKPLIAFALLAQNGTDSMANPGALPGLISPAYWKSISDTMSQMPPTNPQDFVDANTKVWTDRQSGQPRVALTPRIPAGLRYGGKEDPDARRVAIVGESYNGRELARDAVRPLYETMYRDAAGKVRATDTLVSGGSTLADHVAVRLFNEGKVGGLVLMIPGGFDMENHMFTASGEGRSGAATLNANHVAFAAALGLPERATLLEVEKAINRGARVVMYKDTSAKSLFDRNSAVARFATSMIAYGTRPGTVPASEGTLDTWNKSYVNNKQYINAAAPVARPTMRELLARRQAVPAAAPAVAITPVQIAETLGGLSYDGVMDTYDQYTFQTAGTPEYGASFYVPAGSGLDAVRAAMEAKRKAFRDAGSSTPPSFSLAEAENPEQLFSWISQVAAERITLRATVRRAMRDAYSRAVEQYPYEPRKQLEVMLTDKVWYDDRAVRNLDAGRQEALLQALRKFNAGREAEIRTTLAGQESAEQVRADEARAGQPLEPSYSLAVSEVSPDGKVSLQFSWHKALAAIPDRVKKQQTLAQQLQRVQAPKDEAAAFLKWAEGKTGDSAELLGRYEAEVLPNLEIVGVPKYSSMAVDPEDVNYRYEALSVNKGQGEYKEYFIKTPFPVPGQHGQFQDPNLAGWFRVREYPNGSTSRSLQYDVNGQLRTDTGAVISETDGETYLSSEPTGTPFVEVQELQSELFQKNKGGFEDTAAAIANLPEEEQRRVREGVYADVGDEPALLARSSAEIAFLNLMLKDQTWVPVFVSAITQRAKNKGFERVRFPTGETAARVEGHQVLADRLTQLQDRKASLLARADLDEEMQDRWATIRASNPAATYAQFRDLEVGIVDQQISELKTQGIEKLAPIEAFYEKRIAAIVNRMGAQPVTDANGNTWREVSTAPATAQARPPVPSFSLANSVNQALDRLVRNELASNERGTQYKIRMSEYHQRLRDYRKALDAAATVEEVLEANQRHPEAHDTVRNAVLRDAEGSLPYADKAAYRNRFLYDPEYVDARYGVKPRTQEQLDLFDYAKRNNFGGTAPVTVDHSLATAAQWRERLIAPYLVKGIPALHRMLRDEAGWYNKVHGKTVRWYEAKMKEWGLFSSAGNIHAIKEQKLGVPRVDLDTGKEIPAAGTMTRYSASPIAYGKYAGKFDAPEQQLVLLVHSAAKMAVETMEGSTLPDYKALKMKSRVRLNLPVAETEMLKGVVPPAIAEELLSRKAAVVQSLAARKETLSTAEYEHLLALKLAEAGIADFVAVVLPLKPGDEAPQWVARDVIWAVPTQLIEDTFAKSTARDKLLKAGRDAAKLSVRSLARETSAMFDALYEEVNAHAPSIADGGAYLGYRTGYVPHQWGMGFLGQAETSVLHAIERDQRRVESARLRAYEASLERAYDKLGLPKAIEEASDKQLRYLFELKRLPFHGRDTALKAIKADVHKDFGLHKDMTLADAVHEIHKEAMQVLSRRRARGLEGSELNAPIEGTDVTDPLALTKVTGKLLSSFKNREFSSRTRRRAYVNFDEAYRKAGLLPNNVGVVDSVRRYMDDVGMQVRKEMWLNQAVLMQSPEGTPLVIPDPVETFEGENAIKPPTWESLLTRLSEYTGFVRDPRKNTKENLKDLIDRFIAKNPAYRTVESGHASVARYYTLVRRGGEENVMDMLAGGLGFSGGEVGNLVKHVVDEAWNDPWHIVDTLEHANAWMKQMALLGSFFFPIAGIESLVAATGPKALTKLAGRGNMSVWEFRQLIRGNHPYATDLMEMAEAAGIEFAYSMNPMDIPTTTVQKDLEKWAAEAEALVGKKAGQTVKAFGDLLQGQSKFVFEDMFNTMKLWFVHNVLVEEREKAAKAGLKFSAKEVLERWADTVNDALGGQDVTKYSYLTPTMRKVLGLSMFSWNWCVDKSTRALTKSGFKNHEDIAIGEDILVFDKDTQTTRWSPMRDKFVNSEYDGDMVQIKNYNKRILMTPDHTCVVRHDKTGELSVRKARDLREHTNIPRCAPYAGAPLDEMVPDRLVQIAGWLVTDGHITQNKRCKVTRYGTITQSKPHGVEEIKKLGLTFGVRKAQDTNFKCNYDTHSFYVPTSVVRELEQLGLVDGELHWEFLARLSQRQLALLRDTMLLGDGTGYGRFCGKKREVEHMVLLQTMLGLPTTFWQQQESCWLTRVVDATTIDVRKKARSTVHYRGEVWCPTVDTGFWVAEKDGAVFITGNSLSAWNVAGGGALTGPFLKNYMSPTADKFIFLKNWPYMIALVMLAAPAMLQFITYAVSQALGGGDDDEAKKMLERAKQKDSPWIWKNEPGRQMYADITPLVRHSPFYKGEPTGDRRFYIHWGKQSWEIMGWFEKPYATFTSKLSQVARFAIEQATGETMGLGWDLGFKGMGLTGLVMDKEGEFAGSRISHMAQKFAPFSFLAMAQGGDAAPLQMVGPVSKGVSFGRASEAYVGFLRTWAERDTYNKVYKNKTVQANLEALGGDILDAAVRNGYDPKKLIDSARSAVLKDYYGRLYKAIEAKDTAKIEQISYSIARLNGTVEGVRRSIKNRNNLYGKPAAMSPEQLAAIQEAFINPRK